MTMTILRNFQNLEMLKTKQYMFINVLKSRSLALITAQKKTEHQQQHVNI